MTTVTGSTAVRAPWLRDDALLTVEDLHCSFPTSAGRIHAVRGVTFDVLPGETLGLVGESGCGKTTTGRAILQLPGGSAGSVRYRGEELHGRSTRQMRPLRREMQMIFQDPMSSFNPRRKVVDIVAEGLRIQGLPDAEVQRRVAAALDQVGMSIEQVGDRRPHQFSGGQAQRIAIARALALEPKLIVCDEPVASLDVSVQARVLNVLLDIRERNDLAMIFISHDLAVVRVVSDRVAVMFRGRVVEYGTGDDIFANPQHPYTRRLLGAVPVIGSTTSAARWAPTPVDETWRTTDHEMVEVAPGHIAALGRASGAPQ